MSTQVYFEGHACAACGGRADQRHHVVYAQHVRTHKGDLDAPGNFLPLCWDCHGAHHNASRRIPLSRLRDENFAFAKALLGPASYDYFTRRYLDDGDPRLGELLKDEREVVA